MVRGFLIFVAIVVVIGPSMRHASAAAKPSLEEIQDISWSLDNPPQNPQNDLESVNRFIEIIQDIDAFASDFHEIEIFWLHTGLIRAVEYGASPEIQDRAREGLVLLSNWAHGALGQKNSSSQLKLLAVTGLTYSLLSCEEDVRILGKEARGQGDEKVKGKAISQMMGIFVGRMKGDFLVDRIHPEDPILRSVVQELIATHDYYLWHETAQAPSHVFLDLTSQALGSIRGAVVSSFLNRSAPHEQRNAADFIASKSAAMLEKALLSTEAERLAAHFLSSGVTFQQLLRMARDYLAVKHGAARCAKYLLDQGPDHKGLLKGSLIKR